MRKELTSFSHEQSLVFGEFFRDCATVAAKVITSRLKYSLNDMADVGFVGVRGELYNPKVRN